MYKFCHVFRLWIVTKILLLCSTAILSELLFLRDAPFNYIIQPGGQNQLRCLDSGTQSVNYTWCKDNAPFTNSMVQTLRNGTLVFQVSSLAFGNYIGEVLEGEYRCCISDGSVSVCNTVTSLEISKIPRAVLSVSSTTPRVGGALRLVCQTSGTPKPQVQWFKDDQPVDQTEDRFTVLPNNVLQITPVIAGDSGTYHCSATNLLGNAQSPQVVIETEAVHSGRVTFEIISGDTVVTGQRGGSAVLECLVSGAFVDVTWSRADAVNLPVTRLVGHGNLYFTSLHETDAAEYICTAISLQNVAQSKQLRVRLLVETMPVFNATPQAISILSGLNVRLKCKAFGYPPPEIIWYHNGRFVKPGGRFSQRFGSDLFIHLIQKSDEGVYQCFAKNAVGSIGSSAVLRVKTRKSGVNQGVNDLQATFSNSTTVLLTWHLPAMYQMFYIQTFSVMYHMEPGGYIFSFFVNTKNATLTDLQPFANYAISVFVVFFNSRNTTSMSEKTTIRVSTQQSVPSRAPKITAVSCTSTSITLHWLSVHKQMQNGIIIGHEISYHLYPNGNETMAFAEADARNFTLENLISGKEYVYRIAAATQVGTGPFSPWGIKLTLASENCSVPSMVPLKILNGPDGELIFSWSSSYDQEAAVIKEYKLTITNTATMWVKRIAIEKQATGYNYTGARPGREYKIDFFAVNACGEGLTSSHIIYSPDLSFVARNLWEVNPVAISSRAINLTWTAPHYHQVSTYSIYYRRGSFLDEMFTELLCGRNCTFKMITGLLPYRLYHFQVKAHYSNEEEDTSPPVFCMTLEGRPSAPQNVQATLISALQLNISWDPPALANGKIVLYTIYYASNKSNRWYWRSYTKLMDDKVGGTFAILQDLEPLNWYFIYVTAATSVGAGPPSKNISVKTGALMEAFEQDIPIHPDLRASILVGVILASLCITVCSGLLLCRHKKCTCIMSAQNPPVGTQAAYKARDDRVTGPVASMQQQRNHESFILMPRVEREQHCCSSSSGGYQVDPTVEPLLEQLPRTSCIHHSHMQRHSHPHTSLSQDLYGQPFLPQYFKIGKRTRNCHHSCKHRQRLFSPSGKVQYISCLKGASADPRNCEGASAEPRDYEGASAEPKDCEGASAELRDCQVKLLLHASSHPDMRGPTETCCLYSSDTLPRSTSYPGPLPPPELAPGGDYCNSSCHCCDVCYQMNLRGGQGTAASNTDQDSGVDGAASSSTDKDSEYDGDDDRLGCQDTRPDFISKVLNALSAEI